MTAVEAGMLGKVNGRDLAKEGKGAKSLDMVRKTTNVL